MNGGMLTGNLNLCICLIPIRIEYILEIFIKNYKIKKGKINFLENLNILDIGCGGGLVSEPMATLGANVTGIDASEKNIRIAKLHAQKNNLEHKL